MTNKGSDRDVSDLIAEDGGAWALSPDKARIKELEEEIEELKYKLYDLQDAYDSLYEN